MKSKILAQFAITLTVTILGVGCCKPPAPKIVPPAPTAVPTPVATPAPVPSATPAPVATPVPVAYCDMKDEVKPVFFDFDKDAIREDAAKTLRDNFEFLKKCSKIAIQVQGNCDERGTEQYNMALGERRASRVKSFLISLGVDEKRIETVSFGKSRPAVPNARNEDDHQKNRRDDFLILVK